MPTTIQGVVDDFLAELEGVIQERTRERLAKAAASLGAPIPPPVPRRARPARAPEARRIVRRVVTKDSRARAPMHRKGSDRPTSTAGEASRSPAFQGGRPVEREKATEDKQAAPRVRSGKDERTGVLKRRSRQVVQGRADSGSASSPTPEVGPPVAGGPSGTPRTTGAGGSTPPAAPLVTGKPYSFSNVRVVVGGVEIKGYDPEVTFAVGDGAGAPSWKAGDVVIARLVGEEKVVTIDAATMKPGMWRVRRHEDKKLFVVMAAGILRAATKREAKLGVPSPPEGP